VSTPVHVRRLVRASIKNVLAHPETGFNPRMVDIARNFDILPSTVDFDSQAANFIQANLEPSDNPSANIALYNALGKAPVNLVLFTAEAEGISGEHCGRWAGNITARLDWWVQINQRVTPNVVSYAARLEDWVDAVEQAALDALMDPAAPWLDFSPFPRSYRAERDPVTPYSIGDDEAGFIQRIRTQLTFEVTTC
jgi:hypothetical protein